MSLICYVLAAVLFLLAGFNIGHPKVTLGWLGLFFFTIPLIFPGK